MKRLLKVIIVVIVVLALWLGFKHIGARNEGVASKESAEASSSVPSDANEPNTIKTIASAPMGSQEAERKSSLELDKLATEYSCKPGVDCDRLINSAASPEEALWLKRRGYPSDNQLRDLKAMSMDQLEKLAATKNLAAMAVYGDRLVRSGGSEKELGLFQLQQASLHGSVYAAYKLAEAYKDEDLGESAAYYRLAYLEGDWKASTQLFINRPEITISELNVADQRAATLYGRFMERRAKERLPMQIGVRPFEE